MRYHEINETASQLYEARLSQSHSETLFWHGTDNRNAKGIMENGLLTAGEVARKVGGKFITTGQDGVYLTPSFTKAVQFASMNKRTVWSWVFAVKGADLSDINIDEDDVGNAVQVSLYQNAENHHFRHYLDSKPWYTAGVNRSVRAELSSLAQSELSAELITNLQRCAPGSCQPSITAAVGMQLLPHISNQTKLIMSELGCSIVIASTVRPESAWRFKPAASTDVHNDSLRIGALPSLEKHAEKMR